MNNDNLGWVTIRRDTNTQEGNSVYATRNKAVAARYRSWKFNFLRTPTDKDAARSDVEERFYIVPVIVHKDYCNA